MATLRGALSIVLLVIGYWLMPDQGDAAAFAAPWIMKGPVILVISGCILGGFVLFFYSVDEELKDK